MSDFDDDPTPKPSRPPLTLDDSQSRRRNDAIARRLLEEDMAPEQRRLAVRMRSHAMDPYDLLARVVAIVDRIEERHDTGERERSAAIETLLALPKRVEGLEKFFSGAKRRAWAAVGAVALTIVTSAGAIHAAIQASGEAKGRQEETIRNLKEKLDRIERLQDERRGYDYDVAPQHHAKKDSEP